MSNMSYCRFQNTLPDLQDCYEEIHNVLSVNTDRADLSDNDLTEVKDCKKLIALCAKIADNYRESI